MNSTSKQLIALGFALLTWAVCLALLAAYIWAASCLPALALFACGPAMSPTIVTWLKSPVARLICGAAACAWLLWYDAMVWPRRAAEFLRKMGF